MSARKVRKKEAGIALPAGVPAAVYATRVRLGLSQAQMADAIGYETKAVANVELGVRAPTIWMLLKLGTMAEGDARAAIVEALRERFAEGGVGEFLREVA
jgi:DNA-binding XRE family transcriptional regulator